MPATVQAAELTASYRARLARLRDATTRVLVARFQSVDLDRPRDFDTWQADGAVLIDSAQQSAVTMTSAYLDAFVVASDPNLEPPAVAVDPSKYSGKLDGKDLAEALATAVAATYWKLGKNQGRPRALASGIDVTTRVTRSAISSSARTVLADQMVADPNVEGWRRVTSSRPCGACLALAGRRMTDRHVFESHHRCSCSAEPILAGVRETVHRPTGQQMFDDMTDAQRAELFAGTGGAAKARLVATRGLDVLISRANGHLVETPLAAL